jgi:hypothetical protein
MIWFICFLIKALNNYVILVAQGCASKTSGGKPLVL